MTMEQIRDEPAEPEAPEEEAEGGSSTEEESDGEGAGPAEDIQNDPAYNPDDENLKGIKGG